MMRTRSTMKGIAVVGACTFLGLLAGCAGLEYAPKRTIMYYPKELPAAERSVEAAKAAGKDKECPAEFRAAEKAKNDAYDIYWSCRTMEGIAKANEAAALANGLCPPKPVPVVVAPPPPPPPPAAPTVSFSANPPAVAAGKCTTLFWSSENASGASIDQGIGGVGKSGSRQVCPPATTLYTISVMGEGETKTASTTVTVNPPPPPPPPPPAVKVIDRLVVHVNFDTDKSILRKADIADLQKAVAFARKYPGNNISIEGHTDSDGTDKYNQALSERRAAAVKKHLVENGAAHAEKIKPVGYGETRPIADNKTAAGKFQNRRVEILILSE